MARLAKRFFGKKRGEHNMRSDMVGGAWWAVFSLLFLVSGAVMLWTFVSTLAIPEWRANNDYREATCRVLEKQLQERVTEEGGKIYRPEVLAAYEAQGNRYQQWTFDAAQMFTSGRERNQALLDRFEVNHDYPCWYDPLDPARVVVVRGYSWHVWLFIVLPVPFLAIGGGGLVYAWLNWGKSTERRAALAEGRSQVADDGTLAMRQEFPYVPGHGDSVDSAGTLLKYRLPTQAMGWSLMGLTIATIVWLGVTSAFVVAAVRSAQAGAGDWFSAVFALLCLTIGGVAVFQIVQRVRATTGVGLTVIEIDQYPLRTGGIYKIYLSQSGRLKLDRLRIMLACEEEAQFRQGTNLRVETLRVHESCIYSQEQFELTPGQPLEVRTTIEIPATAMHSFDGEHNKVEWRLIVEGNVTSRPQFCRYYSLIVRPMHGGERS